MFVSRQLLLACVAFHLFPSSTDLLAKDPSACRPILLKNQAPLESPKNVNGYRRTPVVSFEVNETGEVQGAVLKRSSGSNEINRVAIKHARQLKFKPQPGCGVRKLEMDLTIDFK
jgi:TonB family protein